MRGDELTVECLHLEELYGRDGEADGMARDTAIAPRAIPQVLEVTGGGRTIKAYFRKTVNLRH